MYITFKLCQTKQVPISGNKECRARLHWRSPLQSLHLAHLLGLFAQLAIDSSLQNPGGLGLDIAHVGFSQMSPAVFPEQASMELQAPTCGNLGFGERLQWRTPLHSLHFAQNFELFPQYLASILHCLGGLFTSHAGLLQASPRVFPTQASMARWPAWACVANRVRAALNILFYSFNWVILVASNLH